MDTVNVQNNSGIPFKTSTTQDPEQLRQILREKCLGHAVQVDGREAFRGMCEISVLFSKAEEMYQWVIQKEESI